ncbi:zinc finger protein 260-like [Mizuhopecten yessoensis]|uniref:Zinc finger protein 234 n=1 Tax=Mizuhopecten yessoensis TaxID=6573 RepID=A0A210PRR8_MIZYE|nr:zinc finger protein 260-like [Mizuhopecten yessoensis]XP_021376786.1 zinc finger protein 260-like [Mizuhopecten yessoensis]XP_021376787.1 zinc finger protein 260-like [Mizuhopecten yessoensis]XP_021376788.1 zinc finger protein 260-like [Mizuhopecten yessoensis]OWF39193.1 Zinc finger protein 234 [Mizuhopecten yessoensis]
MSEEVQYEILGSTEALMQTMLTPGAIQEVAEGEISVGNQEIIIDGMPLQIPAGNYKTEVLEDGTVQVIVYQDTQEEQEPEAPRFAESAIQTDIDIRNRRAHSIGIQNTTVPQFNSYSFAEHGVQTDPTPDEPLVIEPNYSMPAELTIPEDNDDEIDESLIEEENEETIGKKRKRGRPIKNPRVIQNIHTNEENNSVKGLRAGKEVTFHKCGICGKIYKNKTNWMTHLKVHSKEQVFMCGYCGQLFQRYSFVAHVKSHQGEEEAKEEAANAQKKNADAEAVTAAAASAESQTVATNVDENQEFDVTDENGEKRYMVRSHQVTLPNQQVATVIDLGNLIDVAMNAEVTSDAADGADKGDNLKPSTSQTETAALETALAQAEDNQDIPTVAEGENEEVATKYIYKCNVCGKEYNNKSNCHRHLKSHTHDKTYKCDHCDKTYMHRYELKMHSRIHTGEKPFKCVICTRAFNESGNLRRHMKIHAGDDTPYKCGVCFKGFTDLYRLHVHLKVHTGEIKCDTCGKVFGKISDLYRHIRIHTGDKPYKCDQCHKAFCQKVNLQTHYRTHTGKSPFQCELCHFTFSRKQILDNHMKVHAEIEEEGKLKTAGEIKKEVIDEELEGAEVQEEEGSSMMEVVDLSVDEQTGLVEVPVDSHEMETGLTQEELAQLVAATVTE